MSWKQALGLSLSAFALALILYGLFFAKPPVKLMFPFRVGIVNEPVEPR